MHKADANMKSGKSAEAAPHSFEYIFKLVFSSKLTPLHANTPHWKERRIHKDFTFALTSARNFTDTASQNHVA